MSKRRVSYFYDGDTGNYSYGLGHPMKPHRMRMAHTLVSAYKMLEKMDVVRPTRASPQQMTRFHTDEYVDFLHRVTPETSQEMTSGGTRFLVGEDNPAFEGLFEFCSISAGGSINAAERLNSGRSDIAINWAGGLHHAKKREASGFCYVNDIVLSILELLRFHSRVLYIDIDCHHGDGVEEAFYTTDRVMTCSFHKQKDYFPGTGRMEDVGRGKGKGYSVNVPFLNGVTDEDYQSVFEPIMQHIMDWYRPGAVVLQCGADSLSGDKLGVFNLSMHGHANCVRFLRTFNTPLILLGGGGYTIKNVSCVWTYETACALALEQEIDLNLPFNPYLEYYGPRYRLEVEPSNMTDDNKPFLEQTRISILEGLRDLPFAPSVGLHSVPGASVSEETGIRVQQPEEEVDSDMSDLDAEIARRVREAFSRRAGSEETQSSDDAPTGRSLLSYFPNVERYRNTRSRMGSMPNGHGGALSDEDEDMSDEDENRNYASGSKGDGMTNGFGRNQLRRSTRHAAVADGLVFGVKSWLSNDPDDRSSRRRRRDQSPDAEDEDEDVLPPPRPKRTFFRRNDGNSAVWRSGLERATALGVGFPGAVTVGGDPYGMGGDGDGMSGDRDDETEDHGSAIGSGNNSLAPPRFTYPHVYRGSASAIGRGSPMSIT